MLNRTFVLAACVSTLAGCLSDLGGDEDVSALSSELAGTTYYVRTDGGNATQCTGRADAPYPGSGTGKSCAWNSPAIALPSSGGARIAGGDTLMIAGGTYELGSGGFMQPVPSGPSATARTRILGKDGSRPKLVGVGGTHRVVNLEGSSNVEVGNLEITDKSDCVFNHSNAGAKCPTGGAWSRGGLYASASSNVWLHDLDIHGMAARGIQAGGLRDWTVERVKLNRNGSAGWSGDIGDDGSNSGKITLRGIEIGWNGCGERVATGEPWACWAQQTGGYGDGLGTTKTGGDWLIEDAYIHHNTSDGLDLLYMDGADTTRVTVRRLLSIANAGNQAKITGNSLIENSVLVGDCSFFQGRDFMLDGDLCRAYGATIQLAMTGNDVAVVRHNTIAGEGEGQITYANGSSSDKIFIQNNAIVGFPYFRNPSVNTYFSAGKAPAQKVFSGNLGYQTRNCPSGNICDQSPKLTNMTLAGFDARPLAGSPLVDKAPMISEVTTDFVNGHRPVGAANDIGAYELGASSTPPTNPPTEPPPSTDPCARKASTVTLSGPTGAVAAGSAVTYTVAVRNNDDPACYSGKTFFFASAVPSGWTGVLASSSGYINSGTTLTTTLTVTSNASASDGAYDVGVKATSAIAAHAGEGSATYTVAAASEPETCVRKASTVTVTGPTGGVAAGSTVTYTVKVRNNDPAICYGKTFSFANVVPSGWTGTLASTTSYIDPGATFTTTLSVKSPRSATSGTYEVTAKAFSAVGAHAGEGSATYKVAN